MHVFKGQTDGWRKIENIVSIAQGSLESECIRPKRRMEAKINIIMTCIVKFKIDLLHFLSIIFNILLQGMQKCLKTTKITRHMNLHFVDALFQSEHQWAVAAIPWAVDLLWITYCDVTGRLTWPTFISASLMRSIQMK
jgi:hypothetical protein